MKKYKNGMMDLMKILLDEYTNYQSSKTTEDKLNHITEMVFGTFLYLLYRYDYENLLKIRNMDKKEDDNNEWFNRTD